MQLTYVQCCLLVKLEHVSMTILFALQKSTYLQNFILIHIVLKKKTIILLYIAITKYGSTLYISFSHAIGFCFDERSAALLSPRMRRSHRTTPL